MHSLKEFTQALYLATDADVALDPLFMGSIPLDDAEALEEAFIVAGPHMREVPLSRERWCEYGYRVADNILDELVAGRSKDRPFFVSREGRHRLSCAAAAILREHDFEGYARGHPIKFIMGVPVRVLGN